MELLDEIWRLIFSKHLDLLEVVWCRRVSKRFKYLVDQCLTELLVYKKGFTAYDVNDYGEDRSPSYWIQVHQFEPNSSFHNLFANLRVLQLNMALGKLMRSESEFNLEHLNGFVYLEKLFVDTVVISRTQTLRLPKLKVLSIGLHSEAEYMYPRKRWQEVIDYSQQPRLVLDSKVQRLFCERTILLVIRYPECVEEFQCDHMEDLQRNPPTRFQNLRILRALQSPFSEWTLTTFESLERLEELHLTAAWKERALLLNQLMGRGTLRKKVKIYVDGVCLPSEGPLATSMDDRGDDKLKFQIPNYHRLADRVHRVRIWYESLIDWFDTLLPDRVELDEFRFPVGFFRKFLIQQVHVDREVKDEDRFLYFLSRCPRLIELQIRREQLTQSLLDRLPAVCGSLKVLTILHTQGSSEKISGLDLRPVYRLRQLAILRIDSEEDVHESEPLDLLVLFESCRYLVSVKLQHIRIEKRELCYVYTHEQLNHRDNHRRRNSVLSKEEAFEFKDLKSNLSRIIKECKRSNGHARNGSNSTRRPIR